MSDWKDIEEKQRKSINSELQRIQQQRKNKAIKPLIFAASVFGSGWVVYSTLGFDFTDGFKIFCAIATFLILALVIGCLFVTCVKFCFDVSESAVHRRMFDFESDCIKNEMEEDIFENSIKMSCKYLDEYYSQTRKQAQRGFGVSLFVAICGAALLVAGIIAMFSGHTTPSYVTCASGAITEFVSAVFFYLYNKTVSSMSNYHDKLVLSWILGVLMTRLEHLLREPHIFEFVY